MLRTQFIIGFAVVGVSVALSLAGAPARADAPDAAPQPGVWQPHYYELHYMGFTSTYSCSGLSDTLQQLLKTLGTSPDTKVAPQPCTRGFDRPDPFAAATLRFSTLTPEGSPGSAEPAAPSGNKREQQDQDKATTMSGSAAGVWRHVVLAPRHPYPFGEGDCELMQQFRDKVLPMFTIRNLQSDIHCVPHQLDGSNWSMSFDLFSPPPKPRS